MRAADDPVAPATDDRLLAERIHAGPVQVLLAVLMRLDMLRRTMDDHDADTGAILAATTDLRACVREIERSTNVVTGHDRSHGAAGAGSPG